MRGWNHKALFKDSNRENKVSTDSTDNLTLCTTEDLLKSVVMSDLMSVNWFQQVFEISSLQAQVYVTGFET